MNARISGVLKETASDLCRYLEGLLPSLSENWWNELVVRALSYQQQRAVDQRKITALSGLDLAALLRVLDQNWYTISEAKHPPAEARHYVKEMRSVRDRWAHASVDEFSNDDVYRDLDTIQRFAMIIDARDALLEEIRKLKAAIMVPPSYPTRPQPEPPAEIIEPRTSAFKVGQLVTPKSNPSLRGAIVAIMPGQPEKRYSVFQEGSVVTYYESQLAAPVAAASLKLLSLTDFHGHLTGIQIRHPALSVLYSLNAGRIDCVPYQFRPVLKFVRAERPRLLIADGVGVGKTIEAGLILRELQARRDIRSVLIICPKPLITERKWEVEMRRFDERFTPLDGDKLRYCIRETDLDGVWPEQYSKAIVPYSQFDEDLLFGSMGTGRRQRKGLLDLNPPPRFDLVIVDEAQHIRNESTFSHRCVRFFCENAEAVLFLTATPLEMGSTDLFVLLNLLRPDLIRDLPTFETMAAPNPFINAAVTVVRLERQGWQGDALAALEGAATTPWGELALTHDPTFQSVREVLRRPVVSAQDRIACINQLEQLHTFSGMINRTRRRDIGEFTVRKPETVLIEFTPQQRRLHDDLLATQAAILTRLHGTGNVKFMMTMIRRQAASCIFGLAPLLRDILTRRFPLTAASEADFEGAEQDLTIDSRVENQIRDVLDQAEKLDPYDPKLEALRSIVSEKQNLPNHRIMLFSSFRHTLGYLFDDLENAGCRVGLVHGDVPDEDRVDIRRRFKLDRGHPEALDVLLFSEVGSEGLDYQFCDCIVNYDLPWNPMRIEQRIGRIDRRGQNSETVRIFNMVTPGTVDGDIYQRCLLRIGVFDRELGASDEILGEITRELRDIAENFTLSETERQEKLHQLADNQIRLIREQQELEDRQAELFAIRVPSDQNAEALRDVTSYWLSPAMMENLARMYLKMACGSEQDYIIGEKPLKTLRLSQEARARLFKDFVQLPRQTSVTFREWENWLKGASPLLSITFDAASASDNLDATLITPVHPLVRQAARSTECADRLACVFAVQDASVPAGDYPFTIYEWRHQGLQQDLTLQPVCAVAELTKLFPEMITRATPIDGYETMPDSKVFDMLDGQHYALWTQAKRQHVQKTQQLAAYRIASLETSHRARLALLGEQLAKATDERIRRMRQSQIVSAEADYQRRRQEIDRAIGEADITAQPIAFGVMKVTH
ncbi:MAG: DEAD/DEAH box helicase family protein [Acidobacteriia bacterium]|nr:DEAD/DEAH box helicase family protein [Terriglobia bacterium]